MQDKSHNEISTGVITQREHLPETSKTRHYTQRFGHSNVVFDLFTEKKDHLQDKSHNETSTLVIIQ